MQTLIIFKYAFMDYFRSRRFFILLLITVIIGAILTGVIGYFRPQSVLSSPLSFYSIWWGGTISFIVILSAVFFGGDAISGEFQNKTGYFLIGNPIRRSSIYIGKWVAALVASLIMVGVFFAITAGNAIFYFGYSAIPYQFLESLAFVLLYLVTAMGITFFFSSLFKTNSMSILVTVILFLFVFSIVQTLVANLAGVEPWFIVTYGASIYSNVLQSTYPAHIAAQNSARIDPRAFNSTLYYATIPEGITIMIVYFVFSTIGGLLLFERKELT